MGWDGARERVCFTLRHAVARVKVRRSAALRKGSSLCGSGSLCEPAVQFSRASASPREPVSVHGENVRPSVHIAAYARAY